MLIRYALALSICLAFPALANAQVTDVSYDDGTRIAHLLTNVLGPERQGTGLRDPETLLEIGLVSGIGV